MSAWTPVCEVCHGRPKMDRSVCCEDCWYSGAYARWWEAQANPPVPRGFCPVERYPASVWHEDFYAWDFYA